MTVSKILNPFLVDTFFFLAPFCCRMTVLDCCGGQPLGKGNGMTVVLGKVQVPKWLFDWLLYRPTEGGGGQIQAAFFFLGLVAGMWATTCYMFISSNPCCCRMMCPPTTSLRHGRWRQHGQGVWTILQCNGGSSDCLAQGFRVLAGSRPGELAVQGSFTLTANYFFSEHKGANRFLELAPCNMHYVTSSSLFFPPV